ncbi:hypothetical protein SUGI_1012430 [Cryptomeria japonica]|uniref:putative pectate lyase 21 n=1 Tax=Cryptomeria japonica TaxID=3369 RepID=UPI002414C014|nr:putative pectate lyase 21 [Cryptomeria japonica]GLJ47950.1 hypothetical protein SUGI_1012430 [Cryptomeria japonica]
MENTAGLKMWLALITIFIVGFVISASAVIDHGHGVGADIFLRNETISFVGSLLVRNGPMPWVGTTGRLCRGSDGTKCQFSNCGLGHLLPKCAIGFARGIKGGRKGLSYTVTSSDDNPNNPAPGTLRYAVSLYSASPRGVWITFSHDMTIQLKEMLHVFNHTTIDGRGVRVIITGSSIGLSKVEDIIIHNIQINNTDFGTVHIFESKKVWVDHITSFDGEVGLVSAVEGSTDITISNSRLFNNHYNMLLGADDSDIIDKKMRVTIYRNWFKDTNQRNPHCRWGYCHVVNNLYANWGSYAIGARVHAQIYSEKNVFVPGKDPEVTEWYPGYESKWDTTPRIQSNGDLLLYGATFHQFLYNGPVVAPPYKNRRQYPPVISTGRLPRLIGYCSGVLLKGSVRSCLLRG